MIKRDYSEKRDFIRMTINTPAEVILEQQNKTTQGVCNDLSGSGMLLTVDDMLPVNSELMVTLMPEGGAEPMLQARCSVARSLKAADNKCLLGLEILDIIDDKNRAMAS
ncbi:PilZ domain-containing protein [Eionea flava]